MFNQDMGWKDASNDAIDQAIDQFSGLSSAALARVCELVREVDARQSWMGDGARNLTDWISARLRVRHATAAQIASVSLRLADLPEISRHLESGQISLDQADSMSRMATSETEEAVLAETLGLSSNALDRRARRARGLSVDQERSIFDRRELIRQWNLDQSELNFRGRLPGTEGRILDQAIDSRLDQIGPNPETGMFDAHQTRAADALVELAATADGEGSGPAAQVTVFADLRALTTDDTGYAELDNGSLISNRTVQRLFCDASCRFVLEDDGKTVGVGRRSRQIPSWLRELVCHRDGGRCRFPGCRNSRWLQIHHRQPWSEGGPTDLDNLILLCGFHHRFVHERGWHITGPPAHPQFRKPDWTPFPMPPAEVDDRLADLVRSI